MGPSAEGGPDPQLTLPASILLTISTQFRKFLAVIETWSSSLLVFQLEDNATNHQHQWNAERPRKVWGSGVELVRSRRVGRKTRADAGVTAHVTQPPPIRPAVRGGRRAIASLTRTAKSAPPPSGLSSNYGHSMSRTLTSH